MRPSVRVGCSLQDITVNQMSDSVEIIRMHGAKAEFFETPRDREFKAAAEEAPFMIRSLGLGSGIAALAAKGGRRKELAVLISKWLADQCPHSPWHGTARQDGCWVRTVLGKIAGSTRNEYRTAQTEALGYAGWIKKLAQAFCPEDDG